MIALFEVALAKFSVEEKVDEQQLDLRFPMQWLKWMKSLEHFQLWMTLWLMEGQLGEEVVQEAVGLQVDWMNS